MTKVPDIDIYRVDKVLVDLYGDAADVQALIQNVQQNSGLGIFERRP